MNYTVNCTSSWSPWLAKRYFRPSNVISMACLAVLPTIFQSQCSERFHLSSEKEHRSAIRSVANSQWLFHLSQQQPYHWHFCDENYLVLAHTQLFHHYGFTNCHFPNVLVYVVSTYAESSGTAWLPGVCFGHCACVKIFVEFKGSWGQPSMKI